MRSALWLPVATLLVQPVELIAMAMLSLLLVASLMAPHKEKAFDLRDFQRDRFGLLLFLVGVLGGVLYPLEALPAMLVSSLWVLIFWFACKAFKFPLARVWFFPRSVRGLLAASWLFCWLILSEFQNPLGNFLELAEAAL